MIPLALFLLACLAIYVGTVQAAFSTVLRLSLRLMAERRERVDLFEPYLADPLRLLVPARLLLGLSLSVSAVLLGLYVGTATLRTGALLFLVLAAFVLVTEHVVPVLVVRNDPERILAALLPSFRLITGFLRPITSALINVIDAPRERQGGADGAPGDATPADAPDEAEEQAERAERHREERRLLRSIVDFGDTLAREVMTPRPDIVAIRADATLAQLRALFREQEYSRFPVYHDSLDNIVGLVVVKDVIQLEDPDVAARPLSALMRPPFVVPETKRVADLLREFQSRQVQMAIVVDEYGGTAGLVTMEDLLEEIVGEIRDEYDVEVEPIVDEGEGAVVFSAKVSIDEVADRLGVAIEPEGFETVGGFVLTRLGRVPAVGERFELDGLQVEVLEAERRRVHRVRLRRAGEA